MQAFDRLIHGPLERLRDTVALQLDVEHLALEPRAAAHLARDEHVREEYHLDEDVAGAFTGFTAAACDVEREGAGRIAARLRERLVREHRERAARARARLCA